MFVTLSIRQAASFSLSRDQACRLHLGSSTTDSEMCWRHAAAAAAAADDDDGGGCCLCRYTVIDSVFDISVVSVWKRHSFCVRVYIQLVPGILTYCL